MALSFDSKSRVLDLVTAVLRDAPSQAGDYPALGHLPPGRGRRGRRGHLQGQPLDDQHRDHLPRRVRLRR